MVGWFCSRFSYVLPIVVRSQAGSNIYIATASVEPRSQFASPKTPTSVSMPSYFQSDTPILHSIILFVSGESELILADQSIRTPWSMFIKNVHHFSSSTMKITNLLSFAALSSVHAVSGGANGIDKRGLLRGGLEEDQSSRGLVHFVSTRRTYDVCNVMLLSFDAVPLVHWFFCLGKV